MQIVQTYDYYTLEQAREIIKEENRQKALKKQRIKQRKREMLKYYIMQKLMGITLILVSLIPISIEKDGTLALLFVPMGLYLIFTKDKAIIK